MFFIELMLETCKKLVLHKGIITPYFIYENVLGSKKLKRGNQIHCNKFQHRLLLIQFQNIT